MCGEPVSRNPRQNTNTITGTVPRPNKHVRQKPWPNIDPTEEQPILCDYFFWKWKLSAWREDKTKRREDSSFQSFDDRDNEWEWKDKSLEQKDFSTWKINVLAKDEAELDTDFHIWIRTSTFTSKIYVLDIMMFITLIFFINNDNVWNYIFMKCRSTCNFPHMTLKSIDYARELSSLTTLRFLLYFYHANLSKHRIRFHV